MCIVFFVTLSCFPAIASSIVSVEKNGGDWSGIILVFIAPAYSRVRYRSSTFRLSIGQQFASSKVLKCLSLYL